MRLKNGLTPNQQKVVVLTAKQIIETGKTNNAEVGREVYFNQTPESARVSVAETLNKPTVKQAVEDILASKGITVDTIASNINRLASFEPEKVTADVILRANIEAAKFLNMYPDKKSARLNINLKGKIKDMDYSKAKEELQSLSGEADGFITDADVVA